MSSENSDNKRKASDILLSIEEKLNDVKQMLTNQDFILKMMINKSANKISIEPPPLPQEKNNIDENGFFIPTNVKDQLDLTNFKIPLASDVEGNRRGSRFELDTPPNKIDTTQLKKDEQQKLNKPAKVSLLQRVCDKNKKSIFLANVSIKNIETGEEVSKGRTNSVGKYQALLEPGKYQIHLEKIDPTSKKKLELTQEINIDQASSQKDLGTVILE